MRGIDEIFAETLFLGATRGMKRDENRLWMIAEHLDNEEEALAFLSLKTSNLLLTPRRVLELKPHLDVGGMWNVLRFEGYQVTAEVGLRQIQNVEVEKAARGGGRLRLITDGGEQTWLVPPSSSEDPTGNAQTFAKRLRETL
ncbi:MAG: hypothetical protein LN413_02855 [Candidatus Thermoplasmatota archaeon]|nr:hypothetical protein [Candidatus Thermoplasmatota archaeon]